MKRNVLTAKQVAARLGVRLETVYAYVSRGLLGRTLAEDGRTSRFDGAEVERLARRGRPRGDTARPGTVEVLLATAITEIHEDRLLFRGHDATALARSSTFEAVAELLWTGVLSASVDWPAPPRAIRVARAACVSLPPTAPIVERLVVGTAALACAHPHRADLSPASVIGHARAIVASLVELLPPLSRAPGSRDGQARSVARRLWPRLSSLPATDARVAVLDTALVLLSDHELATSTLAARVAASTRADPFSVVVAALGAVNGPLHGKAARGVHHLLLQAASSTPELAVAHARDGAGGLHAFGHSVYRRSDPRADTLLGALGPVLDEPRRGIIERVAAAASKAAAAVPNVDFALGALAFGFQMDLGATEGIFAIARTAGWLAHALEEYGEAPLRFRARAVYVGPEDAG